MDAGKNHSLTPDILNVALVFVNTTVADSSFLEYFSGWD